MSNVLFVYENENPTVNMMKELFGVSGFSSKMASKFVKLTNIENDSLNKAEVIILVRATDSLSIQIAKKARTSGRFVISYYDDDLMNRPTDRPIIPWRRTNVKRILENSNLILSPSLRICSKYAGFTVNNCAVQMHTIIRNEEYRTHKKTDEDSVRIIYAANNSHVALIDKFIKPILPKLNEIGQKVKFYFIGVHPQIDQTKQPVNVTIEYVNIMPFSEYRKYMDSNDFDIGLAPIFDDEFSKCKYINKFLEYSIFQIPGIYTNSEPYSDVIVSGLNGILVNNDSKEWEKAIKELIHNKTLRDEMGENAIATVRRSFSKSQIISTLFSQIPELLEYEPSNEKVSISALDKLQYRFFQAEESCYLASKYAKKSGVLGLIKKVNAHFREYKAFNGGCKS